MSPPFLIFAIILGLGIGIPLCFVGAWIPGLTFSAGGVGALARVFKEIKDMKDDR